MERLTKREGKHTVRIGNEWRRDDPVWNKLAEYEDSGATPDEVIDCVAIALEFKRRMNKAIKDLKYYLDTNEENGVVCIPTFVVEKIVYDR